MVGGRQPCAPAAADVHPRRPPPFAAGTLTPIVEHPQDAVMSDSMREVVRKLAALYPTAIVSGRPIATAHGFVKLDELYYAGAWATGDGAAA